jgi:hypothetical protein
MENRTVTINGVERTFGPIKIGIGRKLRAKYPDNEDYNVAFIAASLRAGGNEDATYEWVDENINFAESLDYTRAAMEANGLEFKVVEMPKAGETQPAGPAAA